MAISARVDVSPVAATAASRPVSATRLRAEERALLLADFDAVVRRHQQAVFRLLLGWVRDEERADALVQETFLRAWRHREGFRGDAAVGTWLRRIAVHVAEDDRRSRKQGFWRRILGRPREETETALDQAQQPAPSAERDVLGRERLAAVWDAVGALPDRQQQVFRLRHLDGLAVREIADVLELAEGTVKVHLSRATHSVRARVAARFDETADNVSGESHHG